MSPRGARAVRPPRRGTRAPPIVAVSGPSGSGKTRLLARLLPALATRGVTAAIVKHTGHPHPFDRPGKDTEVLRRAGAVAAAIEGPDGMAYFGPPAGGLRALARLLPPVDLVLAEGWSREQVPRIEVHRGCVSSSFLCARDPRVFAVVTDEPPPRRIRKFRADDVEPLAALVCARFGLGVEPRGRPREPARAAARGARAEDGGRASAPGSGGRMAKSATRKGAALRGRPRGGSRGSAAPGGGEPTPRTRRASHR